MISMLSLIFLHVFFIFSIGKIRPENYFRYSKESPITQIIVANESDNETTVFVYDNKESDHFSFFFVLLPNSLTEISIPDEKTKSDLFSISAETQFKNPLNECRQMKKGRFYYVNIEELNNGVSCSYCEIKSNHLAEKHESIPVIFFNSIPFLNEEQKQTARL